MAYPVIPRTNAKGRQHPRVLTTFVLRYDANGATYDVRRPIAPPSPKAEIPAVEHTIHR